MEKVLSKEQQTVQKSAGRRPVFRFDYFRKETLGRSVVTTLGIFTAVITLLIGIFLIFSGIRTFTVYHHSLVEFLFSSKWSPIDGPVTNGQYGHVGAAIFIFGSITICFLALAIATPFSLAAAIFMVQISPKLGKNFLQPAIEIFVGIPSVVYGWTGLTVLVPFIRDIFHLQIGFSVLAGAIVLAIMIFPTITSISADAIRHTPKMFTEASYGLGSTRWQLITKVILPYALPGVLTGVILGLARAFGEALAVAMVIGPSNTFPKNILSPTSNLTTVIAGAMGNAAQGGELQSALWSMALLLLVISFVFIMVVRIISKKGATHL
ncbi:phosphate ABC transporter permease subunit PstC [Ethanoligenens harbinense]|uniref:Phosphate transport system permease protein n=1 Tax=Ethanoligenens harbinense (strain DSM 18485 / JCM 12961 / CGMCC 1.5033 / YUAN-3) TaxID=663278 RepID=E6U797_ETHHY|nr:phosphate ABC transporter permease subunit PstC [Ethanoligenens harbinense]ADU25832.1 phosphate ABC transporter, inner membrane subunit PstC [Ethanoligenens harbinense YUAN-3]AVQ94993.1 phosphate ABC transporter permease subunit PstC [Ethanoligenens harbinense YUAN-3]AYF37685.1 phosphate ABC transporter permease subunit PstC [Ethanoligenens harbinense]AYF40405.1 phosphate ABC transporter permease subunit PstC [Ethanoligenens harbinense]QCN91240.1 phosphate ABC transporter permease subunit P